MLHSTQIAMLIELHGETARDRCAELFIRSAFDRLTHMLAAETFVSMLLTVQRTGSVLGEAELVVKT